MRIAKATLAALVRIARASGSVSAAESRLLERYRQALGVSPRFLRKLERTRDLRKLCPSKFTASPRQCIQVLKMLARVAQVDGRMSPMEERLLGELAGLMEIDRVEFAEAVVGTTQEGERQGSLHRRQVWTLVLVVGLAAAVWLSHSLLSEKTDAVAREGRERLNELAADLDQTAVRHVHSVFQEIEREHGPAIVMLHARYDLTKGRQRVTRRITGSGFFVTSTGYIVTNKHVVRRWSFKADDVRLLDAGWRLDPSSVFLGAWPAGARVKSSPRTLDPDTGWTTTRNSLKIFRLAPDEMVEATRRPSNGAPHHGRYHAFDHHDLAVLKAEVLRPVRSVELSDGAVEKLDPVMVLGFPGSISARETLRAETGPSLGVVRKVERTIFVTAPIVPGNSGGPLFDLEGRVIGVAFATYGASTIGGCIPIAHVLPLLPEANALRAGAEAARLRGDQRAALYDCAVAALRSPSGPERQRADALRDTILGLRDELLRGARRRLAAGERSRAREELEAIVKTYGRHWAAPALRCLRELR